MSNLLKRGTTVSKDERVIDYNEMIKAKLDKINVKPMAVGSGKIDADGFVNGLQADYVEALTDENMAEGFEEGIVADTISNEELMARRAAIDEQAAATLENANLEASEIIERATGEANQVIENAREEAERIAEEARQLGYAEGMNQAEGAIAAKMSELEAEFEANRQQLNAEYEEMKAAIEPELINVLMDVFAQVTHVVSEDNQDIILHLINDCLNKSDGIREFTIKVSPDDYNFVVANQGKIYIASSREISMDIVPDQTMNRNECIIETNTGVFNCSLDIELRNLIKNIKLLSSM